MTEIYLNFSAFKCSENFKTCCIARVNKNALRDFLDYKNSGVADVQKIYYEVIKQETAH